MNRADRIMTQLDPNYVAGTADLVTLAVNQGVGIITINNPPMNVFHPDVEAGIRSCYKAAVADNNVKAIVITGGGKVFMAGADISTFVEQQKLKPTPAFRAEFTDKLRASHQLLHSIESGSKPTVAAINGTCFGGGLELAMACNARVAVKTAKLALPELSLGIIPGLAGTQRLPRLVGVKKAVQATLKGKKFNAKAALKMGLVDAVAKSPKSLLLEAGQLALALASGKVPRQFALLRDDKLGDWTTNKMLFDSTRISLTKKQLSTPQAFAALDAIEAGVKNGGKAGIEVEIARLYECLFSQVAKSLVHVFFSQRATGKIPGLRASKAAKKPIRTVAVLGGGTMGSGIALVYLMNGHRVIMKEINEKLMNAAVDRVATTAARALKRMRMPELGIEQVLRHFSAQTTYEGFEKVDLVVEAVVENLKVKQSIFADLERICSKDCIFATNTSSINIDDVSAKTTCRDRIIGLHFFSPAHMMPLLEIIRTSSTSDDTLARCLTSGKKIKKTSVVVGNCVGFTANRIFGPYGQAAAALVEAGVSPYRIDRVIKAFGMPMGPFTMNDQVGLDVGLHVAKIIVGGYPQHMYPSTLTNYMFEAKRLGQKTGKGYYKYVRNRPVEDAAAIEPFLAKARQDARAAGMPTRDFTDEEIVAACLFPVVNESCRVLAEGHVIRSSDIDMCAIMGYGFPAWRGGPMFWATSDVGLDKVAAQLASFAEAVGKNNATLRAFFKPSQALLDLAAKQ
jgi:enoyl-CoA hydratase/3-hydroxyacyl-CoA dehydrogenase